MRVFDVAVIGGNMVGASAARMFATHGLSVCLIEKTPPCLFDTTHYALRVSALNPRVYAWLAKFCDLSARTQPVAAMRVWEGMVANQCHFSDPKGSLATIVENDWVQWQLWQGLDGAGITTIAAPWQRMATTPEGVAIYVEEGGEHTPITARYVLAADGAHSMVRTWAGIENATRSYRQQCIVGNVRTEQPHRATAWQRYHAGLAFAFLPLANGACSIAYYVKEGNAEAVLTADTAQQATMIKAASSGMLGEVAVESHLAAFPLHHRRADAFYKGRVLLAGDAVRTIHPMAGQGANLGLTDIIVLDELLHQMPLDDARLFARYAYRRRADVWVERGMDAINAFFQNAPLAPIRPRLLRIAHRATPIKRALAAYAMGAR